MQLNINTEEQAMLCEAMSQAVKSAKRSQASGKTPHIIEVYKTHERTLTALLHKIETLTEVIKK